MPRPISLVPKLAGMAILLGLSTAINSAAGTLVEIRNARFGDLQSQGFELKRAGEVSIEAVGVRSKIDDDLLVYSWLINGETREPVWVMHGSETERGSSRPLRKANTTINLPAGKYELYMFPGSRGGMFIGGDVKWDAGDFFGGVFGDDDDRISEYLDDCYVTLSSNALTVSDVSKFPVTGELSGALYHSTKMGDGEHATWWFSLSQPSTFHIYSLIEQPEGYKTPVDGAWIMNLDTHERVWEIDRWDTERAGGGKKNRKFDGEVKLEKGRYALHYVTDDSHSFESFNVPPPYDPYNWGITVLPGKGFDRTALTVNDAPTVGKPLIDFTRARNDEAFEQTFRLKAPTNLHIICLGEYSSGSDEFADYGWIQNAQSGRTVWEMTDENTMHAGGAEKNKMFDGEIQLPAGDYIANYVTDGSHSYRDWNAGKPYDPQAWGLAIYPGQGYQTGNLSAISSSEIAGSKDILVSITKVRDNENRRGTFTVTERSKVRIYAIGEGVGNEMADYGWIEEKGSGDIVWEMTYRSTRSAGGASKNRLFDGEIILDPGEYVVYYVTDDSHAFNDWNSTPPRDQRNWGITVSVADKK